MNHDATTSPEPVRRFAFGDNWQRFLHLVDEERVDLAAHSLSDMLGCTSLQDRRFLDVGCGSGLFSLAARRLGARVRSFDFDAQSLACTRELKQRYLPDDPDWLIEPGSVLDDDFLASLGEWDVVYSWGVLHHTGDMHRALRNVAPLVAPGGRLYIAIYNDQGAASRTWLRIKRFYNTLPTGLRFIVVWPCLLRLWGPTSIRDLVSGQPFASWRNYSRSSIRGMSPWRDLVDWVGGLPFEVAKPEAICDLYKTLGFELQRLRTCAGGHGCNEFVFERRDTTG